MIDQQRFNPWSLVIRPLKMIDKPSREVVHGFVRILLAHPVNHKDCGLILGGGRSLFQRLFDLGVYTHGALRCFPTGLPDMLMGLLLDFFPVTL